MRASIGETPGIRVILSRPRFEAPAVALLSRHLLAVAHSKLVEGAGLPAVTLVVMAEAVATNPILADAIGGLLERWDESFAGQVAVVVPDRGSVFVIEAGAAQPDAAMSQMIRDWREVPAGRLRRWSPDDGGWEDLSEHSPGAPGLRHLLMLLAHDRSWWQDPPPWEDARRDGGNPDGGTGDGSPAPRPAGPGQLSGSAEATPPSD